MSIAIVTSEQFEGTDHQASTGPYTSRPSIDASSNI